MDASQFAIGAELIQVQNGVEKVIAFSSFSPTREQQNYCTTRRELLAIVRFTKQFRFYLLGKIFTVRTDHSSLTWLLRFKEPQGQLARWIEELSQYHMVVKHREGSKHGNADALSRIPDPLSPCFKYISSIKLADLPCGGCHYCTRAHNQWAKFTDDADEAINLAVQEGKAPLTVVNRGVVGTRRGGTRSMGVHQVSAKKSCTANKLKTELGLIEHLGQHPGIKSSLGLGLLDQPEDDAFCKDSHLLDAVIFTGNDCLLDVIVSGDIDGLGSTEAQFDITYKKESSLSHIGCCTVSLGDTAISTTTRTCWAIRSENCKTSNLRMKISPCF